MYVAVCLAAGGASMETGIAEHAGTAGYTVRRRPTGRRNKTDF